MFKRLTLHNWRQFQNVDISFHPHLTVLTGANGAGKTTLLHILNRHFGWNVLFISTPRKLKSGVLKFFPGYWDELSLRDETDYSEHLGIGHIEYTDGRRAELLVPPKVQESYQIEIRNQSEIAGLYIPSHRPVYVYKKVETIPTQLNAREQLFENYLNELRSRYSIGTRSMSPSFRIKESLISLAMFGYGNEAIIRNEDAVRTFEGFQQIIKLILPKSLGFKRIQINPPEVVLETETGPFSFDAVSGGIAALIDLAWQLFMCSLVNEDRDFAVVIDEPENHLHPELQRSLLPDCIKAFPRAQFVIATHNPFMVTSVPDSNVYAMTYTPERTVTSSLLDLIDKAGSSNEVLRDVLGLPLTLPLWVEEKLQQLIMQYSTLDLTREDLNRLRSEMSIIGLEHLFPKAVAKVLEKPHDSSN